MRVFVSPLHGSDPSTLLSTGKLHLEYLSPLGPPASPQYPCTSLRAQ